MKTHSPDGIPKPLFWYRTVQGGSSPYDHGDAGKLCPVRTVDYFKYFDSDNELSSCECLNSNSNETVAKRRHLCGDRGEYNDTTGSCECEAGYVGFACQHECDAASTCNGRGTCNPEAGCCVCDPGFVGIRCEHSCNSEVDCNGAGVCNDMGECECDSCNTGVHCEFHCGLHVDDTTGLTHGQCVEGQCQCNSCYSGM